MKEYSLNEQSFSKASSWCCFTKPVEKVEKNSFLSMHKFGASKKKKRKEKWEIILYFAWNHVPY